MSSEVRSDDYTIDYVDLLSTSLLVSNALLDLIHRVRRTLTPITLGISSYIYTILMMLLNYFRICNDGGN